MFNNSNLQNYGYLKFTTMTVVNNIIDFGQYQFQNKQLNLKVK